MDLDLMINEALKINNEAVIEETKVVNDPMYYKHIQKQDYYRDRINQR